MTAIIPKGVTLNQPERELVIQWADGKQCRYPIDPLRLACPCVECRGGHENMGRRSDPKSLHELASPRAYTIERLEIVGNYALQFFWDDGHHTGIYTWEYLYRLCPGETDNA